HGHQHHKRLTHRPRKVYNALRQPWLCLGHQQRRLLRRLLCDPTRQQYFICRSRQRTRRTSQQNPRAALHRPLRPLREPLLQVPAFLPGPAQPPLNIGRRWSRRP
ncbi:hypothetical protein LTR48_008183, partial [Friedmanniomyces endolithicus]